MDGGIVGTDDCWQMDLPVALELADHDTRLTADRLQIMSSIPCKRMQTKQKSLESIKKQGKVDFNSKPGFQGAVQVAVRLVNAWKSL
jgi:hypothetical protein